MFLVPLHTVFLICSLVIVFGGGHIPFAIFFAIMWGIFSKIDSLANSKFERDKKPFKIDESGDTYYNNKANEHEFD